MNNESIPYRKGRESISRTISFDQRLLYLVSPNPEQQESGIEYQVLSDTNDINETNESSGIGEINETSETNEISEINENNVLV